ncbi:LysR family transcriptional regulator [Rhizobium calliandrae]|uniref:LysR family transcriptional regulator n=1 Tax=Rhizobium calliandrae TaxID=1312182 RepID=A0ABT7KMG6_9HYPH|nr:LysR family transcriptional regulator [Rhizobium calliandrae]MDL2409810.1 LysR family transcriptional regulator [Rhizobium calliandrae]
MVADMETFSGSIDDVRAFCAVVDFATLSAAARQLNETKGSISRRISRLEKAVGVRLLSRSPRSVSCTAEGLEFYDKAMPALALLDDAGASVRRSRSIARGTIRITAPIDIAIEVLPEIITSFRQDYPQIAIEVIATDATLDPVAHRIDLALRVGLVQMPDMQFQAFPIAEMKVCMFAAPSYLQGSGPIEVPADLERHALVLPRERPGVTHLSLSNGTREEKVSLRADVRASDFACVLKLAEAGAGIAPLPEIVVVNSLSTGRLVRVLPDWSWSGLTLHAISAPGRQMTARAKAFRDYIKARL